MSILRTVIIALFLVAGAQSAVQQKPLPQQKPLEKPAVPKSSVPQKIQPQHTPLKTPPVPAPPRA